MVNADDFPAARIGRRGRDERSAARREKGGSRGPISLGCRRVFCCTITLGPTAEIDDLPVDHPEASRRYRAWCGQAGGEDPNGREGAFRAMNAWRARELCAGKIRSAGP